jgi:esterase/lipase
MKRMRLEDAGRHFVVNSPENPEINYLRNPISGVRELERLMDYLEPRLAAVTIASLVIQSQEDPVVNPKGSERIFKLLGSPNKEYLVLNFKRHGILNGEGALRVHAVIGDFIRHLLVSGKTNRIASARGTQNELEDPPA